MNRHDPLWELLGKAKKPSVSPFFARNVLRALRQEQEKETSISFGARERFRRGLRPLFRRWSWRLAMAGVCVLAALITVVPAANFRHRLQPDASTRRVVASPDYEVIKHLDELLADEESSVWLDDSVN